MKKEILALLLVTGCLTGQAQTDTRDYRDFPIVVSLQFHNFSLPFRDLKSNFRNIGIGLGTEVSFNGKQNFVQQLSMVWYHNKSMGNGLMVYTQTAWRPTVSENLYSEVKGGVGYLLSFRPGVSYKQVDGVWISAGHKPKGMLAIPVGISVGNNAYSQDTYFSPFVTYQFMIASGFNKSVPIVPETLLQVGTRIHTK